MLEFAHSLLVSLGILVTAEQVERQNLEQPASENYEQRLTELANDPCLGCRQDSTFYATTVALFVRASQHDDPQAQCDLGLCFKKGEGAPVNDQEAVRWFTKASQKGLPQAQYNLALMYAQGRGVELNEDRAIKLYDQAAHQGYIPALNTLAVRLAQGRGVEKRPDQAYTLWQKAKKTEKQAQKLLNFYMYH